jgi:hypothetical protein
MMFRCWLSVALMVTCLVLTPAQAIAADKEQTRDALNTFGREMSTCSAFFALANSVLKSALSDDTTVTARYDAAGKVMLAQASAVADVIGVESDAVIEWSRSAKREMVKEINTDPKNSAALMTRKYDEPCQTLLKESATRFLELIDRSTLD